MAINKKSSGSIKYKQDKEKEKIRCVFNYYERPGETMSFGVQLDDGPMERYELTDGKECLLPIRVANHLNKTGVYTEDVLRVREDGTAHPDAGKEIRRYGVNSLEFAPIEAFEDSGVLKVD